MLVGVKVLVEVTMMVPGTRVWVTVVVVDGVGIDRHEQALEITGAAQVVGIQAGFDACTPRFKIVPTGVDAV